MYRARRNATNIHYALPMKRNPTCYFVKYILKIPCYAYVIVCEKNA